MAATTPPRPDQQGGGLRLTLQRTPVTPGHFMTLAVAGELDTGSIPALCELTSQVLGEGSRHLIMDLSEVTRCDNASFFTLLGVREAAHHAGGSLTLANPSRCVRLALTHSVLRDLLPFHDFCAQEPPDT
ncbi:STAS domain-containing protein [Streptomyces sp. UC4497]